MIKSPHSLADLDKMALVFYRDVSINLRLRNKLNAHPNDYLKPVMRYLEQQLKKIVISRPAILETEAIAIDLLIDQAISDFLILNPILTNKNGRIITSLSVRRNHALGVIRARIKAIFDYDESDDDSFTSRDNGALAYRHAKRLKVNTCPYCNANFTFTKKSKRLNTRPQFDHFLKKSKYPYLALSFYNLVPSCALCNSGALKGVKLFSVNTHLHPLIEDIEGLYEFRTNINAVDFLVDEKAFDLVLQPCKGSGVATRAVANIEVFKLNERYTFHKDIAGDVIKKAYIYNKTAIKTLLESFEVNHTKIFSSESEIKELVMGNYLHPDNFHKRILSKMTKDIAEEFGLTI